MTLKAFLIGIGLLQHLERMTSAGYDDVAMIAEMTDADLKTMLEQELKVEKPGHRMKLVLATRKLRAKQAAIDRHNAGRAGAGGGPPAGGLGGYRRRVSHAQNATSW